MRFLEHLLEGIAKRPSKIAGLTEREVQTFITLAAKAVATQIQQTYIDGEYYHREDGHKTPLAFLLSDPDVATDVGTVVTLVHDDIYAKVQEIITRQQK